MTITIDCLICRLLWLTIARAFWRWAHREIDPLHPDLARVLLRRQELEDQAQRMWK